MGSISVYIVDIEVEPVVGMDNRAVVKVNNITVIIMATATTVKPIIMHINSNSDDSTAVFHISPHIISSCFAFSSTGPPTILR
jgi:hypothetical protein